MNRISIVGLLTTVIFSHAAFGQTALAPNTPRPVKLYYNSSCELTTPDKAFFTRETSLDFENILFSGVCKDFVKGNHLMAEGFFDHGVNKGLHSDYFDDGKLESTIEYADDGFIIWELVNGKTNEHEVAKGTGKFTIQCFSINVVDNKGVTLSEGTVIGEFINGKRNGTWTYEDKTGVKTDEEVYEKGVFKKRNTFPTPGNVKVLDAKKPIIISLTGILTEAFNFDPTSFTNLNQFFVQYLPLPDPGFRRWITYPGGMKKLLLLIARGMRTEVDDNIVVKISVDENGKFGKVKASLMYGSDFLDEIRNLVKPHENKFLPAIKDGIPYAFTMKIPVGNSQQWINYLETATDDDVNAYLDQLNVE